MNPQRKGGLVVSRKQPPATCPYCGRLMTGRKWHSYLGHLGLHGDRREGPTITLVAIWLPPSSVYGRMAWLDRTRPPGIVPSGPTRPSLATIEYRSSSKQPWQRRRGCSILPTSTPERTPQMYVGLALCGWSHQ